mgnify:CR=1 FL=1
MSDIGRVMRRGKPEDRVLLGESKPPPPTAHCPTCQRKVRIFKSTAYEDEVWRCYNCGRIV